MKKLALFMILLVGVFALTACGGGTDNDDRIEIEFWHLSPVGDSSYSDVKQIIRDFNDSQDKYYVNGTGFSFWDYWDKLNVAVASNTAPDVGFSTIDDNVHRADRGVLFNVSDFIAADKAASVDTVNTDVFYTNQLEFLTFEDELYGLPFTATTRMLYYNLDHFEEVGLTEADVPTTWAELETVAKQLDKVDGTDIERIGFDPTYGQGTYMGYLWQAGLDFFDENQEVTLNTQEHKDILNWMVTFNDEFSRAQLNSFGEANSILGIDPFAAGRVSMMIATDGLYQTLLDYDSTMNYAVAPIPLPDENGTRVNWGSGFSLELYTNGRELDDKAQGAWEFTKYIMSKDVQVKYAEAVGWLMGNKEAMAVVAEGNPIITALVAECEYAVDKVFIPYAPAWHASDWFQYYDELKSGNLTVDQTLENARAWYQEKQTNYNQTQN